MKEGMRWTKAQAKEALRGEIAKHESAVGLSLSTSTKPIRRACVILLQRRFRMFSSALLIFPRHPMRKSSNMCLPGNYRNSSPKKKSGALAPPTRTILRKRRRRWLNGGHKQVEHRVLHLAVIARKVDSFRVWSMYLGLTLMCVPRTDALNRCQKLST